jgi:signal transduction histidine kinase
LCAFVDAVRVRDAYQHAIFDVVRSPVLMTDGAGLVVRLNPAAAALMGDASRLQGRPVRDLLPFVPPPGADDGMPWSGAITDSTGRRVHLEAGRAALGDEAGSQVYVLHDISRHAEINRLREELLFNVAHELRGPLTVLDNALDILASDYASLPVQEFGHLVHLAGRTSKRLRTLMEDLLSAGAIQAGRFAVSPRRAPAAAIVEAAIGELAAALAERGQRVERVLPDTPLTVLADPRYAVRVLANLISNASKYSPNEAMIMVRVSRLDAAARFEVDDTGPGIPDRDQAGLFERFYRVRPRGQEPGIGLGLAIAKGIVEAHGGDIGVESGPNAGTRVWFTLLLPPEDTGGPP